MGMWSVWMVRVVVVMPPELKMESTLTSSQVLRFISGWLLREFHVCILRVRKQVYAFTLRVGK